MADDTKKISFGFSKLKKANKLVKPVVIEKEEVQYVDAFDGSKGKFSYKGNLRGEETVKKELIIPLIGAKTTYDVIKGKLESIEKLESEDAPPQINVEKEDPGTDAKPLSIEELAAKELVREVNGEKNSVASNLVIKQEARETPSFVGEKESTLEDYESIPIVDYGLAMLRGMGWKPELGIGKDQKVVQTIQTKLRPKGMGLGADKVLPKPTGQTEDVTIKKNSHVKVISGPHQGSYGRVEGVDDNAGRVVVKLALGSTLSLSEFILQVVDKKEFDKNSKVLNASKYEQYNTLSIQNNTSNKEQAFTERRNTTSRRESGKSENLHRKEKYEREGRKRKSSGSDSNEKRYKEMEKSSSRRRDISDSSDDRSKSSEDEKDRKRKKKNKKDKSRSHSRDRRYKKKKKKKNTSDSSESEEKSRRRKKDKYRNRRSESSSDSPPQRHKSSKKHKR